MFTIISELDIIFVLYKNKLKLKRENGLLTIKQPLSSKAMVGIDVLA